MGLELYGRSTALEAILSPVATPYVGLLVTLPIDSAGEVEISPPGYVRVAANAWTTGSINGSVAVTSRSNADVITFGTYAVPVAVKGWAIYDAPVAGNLVASGTLVDAGFNQAGIVVVPAGDDLQFQPGNLNVSIGPDCPIVVGGGTDTCSLIDSITVNGAPWNIGDPPVIVAFPSNPTIVVNLVAPSTDMPGFTVDSGANYANETISDTGPAQFTIDYDVAPAGVQNITFRNATNSPECVYALGDITTVA